MRWEENVEAWKGARRGHGRLTQKTQGGIYYLRTMRLFLCCFSVTCDRKPKKDRRFCGGACESENTPPRAAGPVQPWLSC